MRKCSIAVASLILLAIPVWFSCASSSNIEVSENASIISPTAETYNPINNQRYLLRWDNGINSHMHTFYDPRGLIVSYCPPVTPFTITKVYIRGYRKDFPSADNKTYTLKIWDGDFKKELYSQDFPYSKFSTGTTLVQHLIDPPLIVTDNFTVDFISHSEAPPEGKKPTVAIYVSYDDTLASNEHAGVSWLGTNDSKYFEKVISDYPDLAHACWRIQVDGIGQAIGESPQNVIIGTENISATLSDPKQDLYFIDNFSNPNSGWPNKQTNSGGFQYDNGSYVINTDSIGIHNYINNKKIGALKDLIVEVDALMESGDKEDYAELIVGWVITKPFSLTPGESRPGNYYFTIFPIAETTWIATWEQAEWGGPTKAAAYLLPANRYTALNVGKQTNNLRFVFTGDRVKAYLNNKLMVDATEKNLLFGYRLIDLGLVEGKYIYLGSGNVGGSENAIVKFDNFKLYKGTQKAFLVPEELKDSLLVKEKIKAAEDYGFDIGPIEYYKNTTDYMQSISKIKASQPIPVAIQVMCQPGERSNLEAAMTGYIGEVVYDEINLTEIGG